MITTDGEGHRSQYHPIISEPRGAPAFSVDINTAKVTSQLIKNGRRSVQNLSGLYACRKSISTLKSSGTIILPNQKGLFIVSVNLARPAPLTEAGGGRHRISFNEKPVNTLAGPIQKN